jgi:hypothetical protein
MGWGDERFGTSMYGMANAQKILVFRKRKVFFYGGEIRFIEKIPTCIRG